MALPILLSREDIIASYRSRIAAGKRSKLSATELETLIEEFVTRLATAGTELEIRALCDEELALLEEGFAQRTLASDYLPKYRRAIERAIESGRLPVTEGNSHSYTHIQRVTGVREVRTEHYGLTFLKYDAETYEALDTRSKLTNRAKQLELQAVQPWRYLEGLEGLLGATEGFVERKRAIALAGLTGRRIGEILQRGRFSLGSHPYLLQFEGHSKTDRGSYEVVTLLPAKRVLGAIEEFRKMPEIVGLMEGEDLERALGLLNVQINRVLGQVLGEVVPPLPGRKGISVHNLRSLWGAIACYFFCPPNAHEYAFLQHYLGHVMESSATGHYFRYQLVNEQGKPITAKGVKLASVMPLPIATGQQEEQPSRLKAERQTAMATTPAADASPAGAEQATAEDKEMRAEGTPRKRGSLRIDAHDHERWATLLDELCPGCPNQIEKMSALLAWAERQLNQVPVDDLLELDLDAEPSNDSAANPLEPQPAATPPTTETLETIAHQAQTLAFLSGEIEELRRQVHQLQQERDQAQSRAENSAILEQTINQLRQERATVQQEADRLRKTLQAYLNGNGDGHHALAPETATARPAAETQAQPTTVEPAPAPATPTRTTRKGSAFDRALAIVERIMQWNKENPNDTWAITAGLMESTFGINRKALHSLLEEYQPAIDQHHRAIGVTNARGHNRRKDEQVLKGWVENALNASIVS